MIRFICRFVDIFKLKNETRKSVKSPLWLRLLPVIFLISIPITLLVIYGFIRDSGGDSDGIYYFIGMAITFALYSIILSIITILFPFAGGIFSLFLLLTFLVQYFPDNFQDINIIFIYVFSMLFLAGITGIYVGVRNYRYRKNFKSSVNY